MSTTKTMIDKMNKKYHFELFNMITNEFSGKDFTTDDLMEKFFGLKQYTPKESKAPKDPDAPKRAQSAYFHFSADKRPEIMEKLKKSSENGKIDVTLVSKELGKIWKTLSDKKKKPYEESAEIDKQRYQKEKKEYGEKKLNKLDESD